MKHLLACLALCASLSASAQDDNCTVLGIQDLTQLVIQLQASIDSIGYVSSSNVSEIDSIYVDNESLKINLSNGSIQSFPLPQPVENVTNYTNNSYSSSDVPLWMLHLKQSIDIDHGFNAALEHGLLVDANDFKTFFETVPEALFNVTFPYDCATGTPYDIPYGFATTTYGDGSCFETVQIDLHNADLSFASISGSSCPRQDLFLWDSNCIGSRWTLPQPGYSGDCSFRFPLYATNTNFSHSKWSGNLGFTQALRSFTDCNFTHSTWQGVEFSGDFHDCDLSYAIFYNVGLGSWRFDTSIMTGAEFRCMHESYTYIGDFPPEWLFEPDPECTEPNRYRFFQP